MEKSTTFPWKLGTRKGNQQLEYSKACGLLPGKVVLNAAKPLRKAKKPFGWQQNLTLGPGMRGNVVCSDRKTEVSKAKSRTTGK